MAIALVQKTAQQFYDGVTTASRTITGVTAGNLLTATVSCASQPNNSPVPALPTPTGWTAAIAPTGSTGIDAYRGICAIYYIQNAGSGSHTIDFSGGAALPTDSYAEITIEEWSGAETTGVLDVVASSALATPQTSGTSGTTATTAQADALAVTVGVPGGGSVSALSTPPSSGYTGIDTSSSNATTTAYDAGYKILSATGTQSASWTWTGNGSWVGVIAVFKAAAVVASQTLPSTTALPPEGRNYDFELAGWQARPLAADNEVATTVDGAFDLAPIGRDYAYELEGWQQPVVVADNSEAASIASHFDLTPAGRDFDYELSGWKQEPLPDDNEVATSPAIYDLPSIGRNFKYELEGWKHTPIEPFVGTDPIVVVQQTAQQFYDNVTSASRTITGVTLHSHLIALFNYFDVDNSASKSPPTTPSGWLVAEAPSGPIDANAYMGQSAMYYKQDVAAGNHTIEFTDLRSGTFCEITIVEVSGLDPSNALDVHTFGLSPSHTTVTSGQVGPTSPSTFANSIVFAAASVSGGGTITDLSHPATTGYTGIDNSPSNATHVCYSSNYKILSATGAQQANWTWTLASNYTTTLAVFKGQLAASPPVDIAANWTANTPLGHDFEYELEGYQTAPLADDNDVGQAAVSFEQLPIGRDFDYQLEGYQFGVVGPDFTGDDALTNGVQDIDVYVIGEDFDYQLEGFQQGVVGANADQSNVIPMWFEVPQTVINYGHHLTPFFFGGVGPDGIPLHSEVMKWTDNPPVLYVPEQEEWVFLPIPANAAPALTSNTTQIYENPQTFRQVYPDISDGFTNAGVGPDFSVPLASEPTIVDELPYSFLHPAPAYDSFFFGGVKQDANFTDAVTVTHFNLPPAGRDFEWELDGFKAAPPIDDNTVVIAAAYYELPAAGRDFDYELAGYQAAPLADENNLAASLGAFDLTPIGRDFDYQLEGHQYPIVGIDVGIEPVGLSIAHHSLPADGRDFEFELEGWQIAGVGPDAPDTFPLPTSTYFDMPPAGRDFNYDLTGFQAVPLSDDYFEVFVLMGMVFPATLEPKYDERDITPFLGEQVGPVRSEVLPFNNSGPSFYIPTYRPRRR